MTMLDDFLAQAWNDHADQAPAVAARLAQGLALAHDDDGVMRLASLAHHVHGEHLGSWAQGLEFLDQLAAVVALGAAAQGTLARCRASLVLSAGQGDGRAGMTPGDRCRVTAMAACNLASRDVDRATALLDDAVAQAGPLANDDPAVRALAANANGMAGTLQELSPLTAAQAGLMLRAAEVARTHWERAGTWLEVERAEYRLAVCCLAAGDARRAALHASHCDTIVRENGAQPLEVFFAAEAMALSARALGDAAQDAAAVAMAKAAFESLDAGDQGWCRATLEKLEGAAAQSRPAP